MLKRLEALPVWVLCAMIALGGWAMIDGALGLIAHQAAAGDSWAKHYFLAYNRGFSGGFAVGLAVGAASVVAGFYLDYRRGIKSRG